ncbi:hypothetical protein ACFLRM_00835 [Acidobacteriota bacterium]
MTHLKEKIILYFTEQPLPQAALQITARYVSGIQISPKEKKIKHHFVVPLDKGVVHPLFSGKNITNPLVLEKKIKEGWRNAFFSDKKIALLLPELSQKSYVLPFDSLPVSHQERARIIRFRIKKQMPLLPEDVRISFDLIRSNHRGKILATIARKSVINEYEDFFSGLGLKIKTIGIPSLCLPHLLDTEKEKDSILLNIEKDFFSLGAVINSNISLYRQKSFILGSQNQNSLNQKIESIIQELINTSNFIEDREKKKIESLWIRLGMIDSADEMFTKLEERLSFLVKDIASSIPYNLHLEEKRILSPLFGQIL